MEPLVIYHGNCNDGFCAACIAHEHFGDDAEYLSVNYGPERDTFDISRCEDRSVYIVDFSFPRAVMIEMAGKSRALLVLDHHKTAQADCEGLDFCIFDMDRSGAGMTWDFFFPSDSRPWLVDYVEDRDLWNWAYEDSKSVNACITSTEQTFEAWNALGEKDLDQVIAEGRAIQRYIDQYTDEMCAQSRLVCFDGYTVPLVNAPYKGISEIVGKLAEGAGFAMGYSQTKDGSFMYSLRSRGDFDVSELAKKWGGGGHKNAAGFTLDRLIF